MCLEKKVVVSTVIRINYFIAATTTRVTHHCFGRALGGPFVMRDTDSR